MAKTQLLVIDDWGMTVPDAEGRRDLLEILDDRHQRQSTLITSQIPVSAWHDYLKRADRCRCLARPFGSQRLYP